MEVTLREDLDPDTDFYFSHQFEIYHEPYLLWNKETWETILTACDVYRVEVNGKYAGDILLEERGRERTYIIDFSLLPEYQGKGIGKVVLEKLKKMSKKLMAVTRKDTLDFFLKSGFILKKLIKNYYDPDVDGYYLLLSRETRGENLKANSTRGRQ